MLIRPAEPGDLEAMQRIGGTCVPGIPSTGRDRLRVIADQALLALIGELQGQPAGFALLLDETADYDSPNFRWFRERRERFAYVDRVGVLPEARRSGLGRALYLCAFRLLAGRRPRICCEVNEQPPNPGSLHFHRQLGFAEVGRAGYPGDGRSVIFLEATLPVLPAGMPGEAG